VIDIAVVLHADITFVILLLHSWLMSFIGDGSVSVISLVVVLDIVGIIDIYIYMNREMIT
jgi:hypothetical protein